MTPSKVGQVSSGGPRTSGAPVTSGLYSTSTSGLGSGNPVTSGPAQYDQFMIGDAIDVQAPIAFRIAPRIYALARTDGVSETAMGAADSAAALAELPLHLAFRESAPHDRSRQYWESDDARCWQWQLVVEQAGDKIAATLTARHPRGTDGNGRLVWRSNGDWEPFGANRVYPELAGSGAVPLIVRAP